MEADSGKENDEDDVASDDAEQEKKPMMQRLRQQKQKNDKSMTALCDKLIAQLRKENADFVAEKREAKRLKHAQGTKPESEE